MHRREVLKWAGASFAAPPYLWADQPPTRGARRGLLAGQPEAVRAGQDILDAGGNAVDAAVAAALVAGVVAIADCGPGGYGGHLMLATGDGRHIRAIDFNTAAPRAARPDMFPLGPDGQVRDRRNAVGWLAAGVPGTLAGLQLALDRYGSLPLGRVLEPAIRYARDGITVTTGLVTAIRGSRAALERDPASARLLLPGGNPPAVGSRFCNPDLANLLETLARRNSVESFYRGDIARRIAAAFAQGGGLVTAEDLAAYRAREVEPLELSWRGYSIRTAPLTAGGLSVLEALSVLGALTWPQRDPDDPRTTHLRVETLRVMWDDRLRLLGDRPDVPSRRLLSEEYGRQLAGRIETAVREGRRVPATTDGRTAGGTIHLSAVDAAGTMVALTLTHGEAFGARVTVDGLGLILGHGMVRFDPHPGHPNAPGPGKRPLHNMCPTIVLKEGRPLMAVGGRGGRRIPSALFDVLSAFVGRGMSLADAVAASRLHTEGGMRVMLERTWPEKHVRYLRRIGYEVSTGSSAIVYGVAVGPRTGERHAAGR